MYRSKYILILGFTLLNLQNVSLITIKDTDDALNLNLEPTADGITLSITKGDVTKQTGKLGVSKDFSKVTCIGDPICKFDNITFSLQSVRDGFKLVWETQDTTTVFQDCFDLEDEVYWYGGPEQKVQQWPIQNMKLSGDEAYVTKKDSFSVSERYWLSSKGVYLYVDSKVPLFVDQNTLYDKKLCFIAKVDTPYVERKRNFLEYHIIAMNNPKEAHLSAINFYLNKPNAYPDTNVVENPVFTTRGKYKNKDIDDKTVLEFAKRIRDYVSANGTIQIDDKWENCYGSMEFDKTKFANIANTIQQIKDLGLKVVLWTHPFVNIDCESYASEGFENGFFVKDITNNYKVSWWNGEEAYQIDFTNPAAVSWFTDRLKNLQQQLGIDSFTFDAGETNYGSQPSVYATNSDIEDVPNIASEKYARTAAEFGSIAEARVGSRTQDLPIFIRMLEKDTSWGEGGLQSLIPTLLQMNMNGYPLVMPSMIGGNRDNDQALNSELLLRWTEAETYMAGMKFGYLASDFPNDEYNTTFITQNLIRKRYNLAEYTYRALTNATSTGAPVNPPIWWIAPEDPIALACGDQFMIGEKVLVAPILEEGQRWRYVYLPKGTWMNGNNDGYVYGGKTYNFTAKIEQVLWFVYNPYN